MNDQKWIAYLNCVYKKVAKTKKVHSDESITLEVCLINATTAQLAYFVNTASPELLQLATHWPLVHTLFKCKMKEIEKEVDKEVGLV